MLNSNSENLTKNAVSTSTSKLVSFVEKRNEKYNNVQDEETGTQNILLEMIELLKQKTNYALKGVVNKLSNNENNKNNMYSENLTQLEKDIIVMKNNISWLSKVFMPTMVALVAIIVTVMIFGFSSTNSNTNSKFEIIQTEIQSINNRLDYQEKINNITIENEVRKQITEQKSKK